MSTNVCPKCGSIVGMPIVASGDYKGAVIVGNSFSQTCPDCGHDFDNNYEDGEYDFKDGIPYLVKSLSELALPEDVLRRIKKTPFERVISEDKLLEKTKFLHEKLYSEVNRWFKNGVTLTVAIAALTAFNERIPLVKDSFKTIQKSITERSLLPRGANKSFYESKYKNDDKKGGLTIPETRNTDSIDADNLRNKL